MESNKFSNFIFYVSTYLKNTISDDILNALDPNRVRIEPGEEQRVFPGIRRGHNVINIIRQEQNNAEQPSEATITAYRQQYTQIERLQGLKDKIEVGVVLPSIERQKEATINIIRKEDPLLNIKKEIIALKLDPVNYNVADGVFGFQVLQAKFTDNSIQSFDHHYLGITTNSGVVLDFYFREGIPHNGIRSMTFTVNTAHLVIFVNIPNTNGQYINHGSITSFKPDISRVILGTDIYKVLVPYIQVTNGRCDWIPVSHIQTLPIGVLFKTRWNLRWEIYPY